MSDPVIRYKKAIGKPGSFWVSVSSLKSQVEGGMLDPDDLIADVCDDREQLQAIFDEQPFSGHHGDGMSSCSNTSDTSDKDAAVEPAVAEPVGQQKSSLLNSDQKTQQLRRGSEPVLSGGSSGKTGSDPAAAKGEPGGVILPAAGSVQAVVASINAINSNNSSSNNKREHFIKHRSKSSLNADNFWNGFSGNANPSGNGFHRASSQVNELRSSLRNVTSSSSVSAVPFLNGGSSDFQIIHTSPSKLASGGGPTTASGTGSGNGTLTSTGTGSTGDSDDNMEGGVVHGGSGFSAQGFSTKLNVLRRREPLGASANKPGDEKPLEEQPPPPPKPAMELVPILKNSKSAGNLLMQADPPPSFEIVIQNEIGPLGIHLVPCDEDGRLVVQGIEPGGRIDRDGRLAVGDEIIRINGYPLESTSFNKAQEVFKEALFAKELRLRVIKGKQLRPLGCSSTSTAAATAADDSLLNVSGESDTPSFNAATSVKAHTLPRATEKLAAGTKITTAVHANNTRKIGTVIPIRLVKGSSGLGFSITTRDNALGGNTPIYIKNILPKGAAIDEGTLKPGDRLLEVNEICVDGMTQSEVVTLLRNAPLNSEVNLVVSRHMTTTATTSGGGVNEEQSASPAKKQIQFHLDKQQQRDDGGCEDLGAGIRTLTVEPLDCNNMIVATDDREMDSLEPVSLPSSTSPVVSGSDNYDDLAPSTSAAAASAATAGLDSEFPWKQRQILTFDIPVHDTERAGLGVSVKGKTSNNGGSGGNGNGNGVVDLGIFVKSVIHGGAASRDGRLKTNDQLVNINGMSLLGKANPEAMETLRKAMHDEGPIPGVISLTVARRKLDASSKTDGKPDNKPVLKSGSAQPDNMERRNSVSSLITSSDEDMIREYNVSNSKPAAFKVPSGSQLSSLIGTRNPVVDRLMGKDTGGSGSSAGVLPSNLRNDSYYMATHQDATWNATLIQQQLGNNGGERVIAEEDESNLSVKSSTNTLNNAAAESDGGGGGAESD